MLNCSQTPRPRWRSIQYRQRGCAADPQNGRRNHPKGGIHLNDSQHTYATRRLAVAVLHPFGKAPVEPEHLAIAAIDYVFDISLANKSWAGSRAGET